MALETVSLTETISSVAAGATRQIGNYDFKSVQVSGTFTGTWEIQINNGGGWVQHATGTAADFLNITIDAKQARANVTALATGSIKFDWFLRG